jgi:hypothetical protein
MEVKELGQCKHFIVTAIDEITFSVTLTEIVLLA